MNTAPKLLSERLLRYSNELSGPSSGELVALLREAATAICDLSHDAALVRQSVEHGWAAATLAPPSGEGVAYCLSRGDGSLTSPCMVTHGYPVPSGPGIVPLYASPPATVGVGALRRFAERLRLMDERTLTVVRSARLMVTDKQYEVVTLEPAAWQILRDYIRQRGNLADELAALIRATNKETT